MAIIPQDDDTDQPEGEEFHRQFEEFMDQLFGQRIERDADDRAALLSCEADYLRGGW